MRQVLTNLPAGVEKQVVARVLDCCEIASQRQQVKVTDFMDRWHREFVRPLVAQHFGIRYQEDGGYSEAERCRLIIYPDYYRADDLETTVSLLEISLSDATRLLSHRDYLGAVTGAGVDRGSVGDIITFDGGGQVFVATEVRDALLGLSEVSRFQASTREVPPYQVRITQQPVKTISGTVASLRLDAVLSNGLGTGRSAAAQLIRSGKVRVNWREIDQPSFSLNQGDVVTVRGKGRLELAEAGGETRKGRTRIAIKKYS